MRMSKRPYPGLSDHPNLYRDDFRLWQMKLEYPDSPVGEALDRMHRLNRFVLQYGNLFVGGDHMARFHVQEFLNARRQDAPAYVRAVDGLTLEQTYDFYRILMHEVAPVNAFFSIGLEELKDPNFDSAAFFDRMLYLTCRWCSDTPTLRMIYYLPLFPVNPSMATDDTRDTLKVLTNERIRSFNADLRRFVENMPFPTHGKVDVAYLDLNRPLTDRNGELREHLTADGIHLTPDAYWRIFDQIKDIISYPAGAGGSIAPESHLLRMTARIEALERYVLEHGLLTDGQLADFNRVYEMRNLSQNQQFDSLAHFLPDRDLRDLAQYIVYYAENPIDVARRFDPESLASREYEADEKRIEFPNGENSGDNNGGDDQ